MKTTKKVLCMLMVVLLCLTSAPLHGLVGLEEGLFATKADAAEVVEGYYTYEVSNGEATITDCDTSISGDVVIPDTLGGYPVTSIGYEAFEDCTGLTSVTIGNGVTSIGDSAFAYCGRLTSVTIGNSVTSIGGWAFNNCGGLTSVTIGNAVTSIDGKAFNKCRSLTSVDIPNSVTSIGERAFANCTALKEINVSSDNASYASEGGVLFNKDKTELIQYPAGKEETEYSIPVSVISIGDDAFSGCTSLTNIDIPNSVTSIGNYAFDYCTGLTSIDIPNSVTSIGKYVFCYCIGLTSVDIPDSVISIGNWAFDNCTGLTSVTIGNGVANIGYDAFYHCTALKEINVSSNNASYASENGVLFNKDKTELIRYPASKEETQYSIPDSVISIDDMAFDYCTGLSNVTIGNSVTSIGSHAFYKCTALTSIDIPDSVKSIGSSAFAYCTGLTSVTIGNGVTSIGYDAFYYCTALKEINVSADNDSYVSENGVLFNNYKTRLIQYPAGKEETEYIIPDSVTSIGPDAFYGCTGLTSIDIPDSVIDINRFSGCTALKEINVSSNHTLYMSENGVLFNKDKTKLIQYPAGKEETEYSIPDSVTSIGYLAFEHCTGLTSVNIPDSVTSIDYHAFDSCTALKEINASSNHTLYTSENGILFSKDKTEILKYPAGKKESEYSVPSSVTSIGYGAFSYCAGLTSVELPDSLTGIDSEAFTDCTGLTCITIPDGVMAVGFLAFNNCSGLTTITIPDSVAYIGLEAFCGCSSLQDVYYTGSEQQWNSIVNDAYDEYLLNATIHYSSDGHTHSYTSSVTVPATCEENGTRKYTCSCGDSYTEAIPALGHTPGEWEIVKNPTAAEEGKKVLKCTECGEVIDEAAIAKLAVVSDKGIDLVFPADDYNGEVAITVEESFDGTAFEIIAETANASQKVVYDIKMTLDGEEIQPGGKVTVRIPLPAGYDPARSVVYHVDTQSGKAEQMNAVYEDGYLVFETDHFSFYAVAELAEENPADNCKCNCHKSGIVKFFFKIALFFQRIFGKNKICSCGVSHY